MTGKWEERIRHVPSQHVRERGKGEKKLKGEKGEREKKLMTENGSLRNKLNVGLELTRAGVSGDVTQFFPDSIF